jgi:hypothetical protein
MCYEETFFQRWTRKRAQQRQESAREVERVTPATQPSRPATSATPEKKRKEPDRELETV